MPDKHAIIARQTMDKKHHEDLYELLDEMNARIEDIVEGSGDSETLDIVMSHLGNKVQEFLYDFEQEIEKIELIETEM